ncbi:MAG TPA: carbamate kinase [Limnochorda sp.]
MGERLLIALGGNAILRPGQRGSAAEQLETLKTTARALAGLVEAGHQLGITHGNGPQVGNVMIQQHLSRFVIPPWPMDLCGAATQGVIGAMIQQTLRAELSRRGLDRTVVSLVTHVRVDPNDPAFHNPTKPVGPVATREEAAEGQARGEVWAEEKGRGWRRVVPSPMPLEILEAEAVRSLLEAGVIPVAAGGGGVPVVRAADGSWRGVEAVIDKDLASSLLARTLGVDRLLILTDVDAVYRAFGKPGAQPIAHLTVSQARELLATDELGKGNMAPKVRAAADFAEAGGVAHIGALEAVEAILAGQAGTCVSAA